MPYDDVRGPVVPVETEPDDDYNLDFSSLEIINIPVKGPDGTQYILREAMGDAATAYHNKVMEASQFSEDGKVTSVRGLADVEPLLVSMCLYYKDRKDPKTGNHLRVPIHEVKAFPGRMLKKLYATVKKISDLDQQLTEEQLVKQIAALQKRLDDVRNDRSPAKNGHSDTEDGSE